MRPSVSVPSKEEVADWLSRNWIPLALAAAAAAGFALSRFELSTSVKVALVTVAAVGLLGWTPASRIVDWLYTPAVVHLLVLKAEGGGVRLYRLPAGTWRNVEVVEGELYRDEEAPGLYVARTFNPVELTATGTWRGSLSDIELLRNEEKIREVRENLEARAKAGEELRIRFSAAVRTEVQRRARHILEVLEERVIAGDGSLEDFLSQQLDSYDDMIKALDGRETVRRGSVEGNGDTAPGEDSPEVVEAGGDG